jgi:DNA invertase Pin-like site-specific DNA recombinase
MVARYTPPHGRTDVLRVKRGLWPMAAEPGPGFRWGVLLRKSKPRERLVDGVKVFEFDESMDAHELELVTYLRSNGMGVIVETYKEIASAYRRGAARPRYKHALSDLEAGTIDGIAVLAVDRLTRRRDQTRPILNALEQMGGRLFALWDELDTASDDPDTELRLHELVARAEREAERMAKRYKLAAQHRAHKGLPQRGGVRPYGHTDDWQSLVPVEAENLHKAALQIVGGKSPLAIARDWTAREISTVRGGSVWWHGNLREMLRSARMIGKREYDGALIVMPGVPAILDEELWRQVREILTPSYRTMGRRESRQCSNLALCSVCGLPLVSNIDDGRPTYTCKKRRSQPGACGSVSVSGKRLDERVSREVVAFLNDKKRVQALLDAHKMTGPEMDAIDARFAELEDNKLALERAAFNPPQGVKRLPTEHYWKLRTEIEAEQEQLQRRRVVSRAAQPLKVALKQDWTIEAWLAKPVEYRRTIIKLVCKRSEVAKAPMKGGGMKGAQGPYFDPERIRITFADEQA